jgi:hypothetical protein
VSFPVVPVHIVGRSPRGGTPHDSAGRAPREWRRHFDSHQELIRSRYPPGAAAGPSARRRCRRKSALGTQRTGAPGVGPDRKSRSPAFAAIPRPGHHVGICWSRLTCQSAGITSSGPVRAPATRRVCVPLRTAIRTSNPRPCTYRAISRRPGNRGELSFPGRPNGEEIDVIHDLVRRLLPRHPLHRRN